MMGDRAAAGGGASPETALAAAHARFARAAMALYLATAAIGVALLVATLASDRTHQYEEARARLSLETRLRAQGLARHLDLLGDELTRLGLRSEVDTLDENPVPERGLLRQAHEKSALFKGVAILGQDAGRIWSEPEDFLPQGWPEGSALIEALRHARSGRLVFPRMPSVGPAVLYVAAPVVRNGRSVGALVGAVHLVLSHTLDPFTGPDAGARLALVASDGIMVFPSESAGLPDRLSLARVLGAHPEPFVEEMTIAGSAAVVVGVLVEGTDLRLLCFSPADSIFGPARERLRTRLLLGLTLASVPLLGLVLVLRSSLVTFRRAEEDLLRSERLRSLGEAVDLIAHEVKNSLNSIRVGLDLIVRADRDIGARQGRVLASLRSEIERLAGFTTELLGFSKGVVPRPTLLDLAEFVAKVTDLHRPAAEGRGARLEVVPPGAPVRVKADPSLVHVVVANLVGNALEFAGNGDDPPRVVVEVRRREGRAEVRVADNGPGVSRGIRPRLFEPFVTGKPNGVGIGLALSKKIARAHGGDLVLENALAGASFLLTLPKERT